MNVRNRLLLLLCSLCLSWSLSAQAPQRWTSSQLHEAIEKLNFLGSALYVAAHPDDENTTLIAYLSNVQHANTAYLSLTRGDGGQNLIGPEIRELLGIIRTQELLAARRIDGGHQFFSRANDFGYSKNPAETFNIWDRETVLSDVVWTIRRFQPDIIINRFDHSLDRPNHGHHTASAILSLEAFDLAGDPNAYPEQLAHTDTWQPTRIFHNFGWWRYGSIEEMEKQMDRTRSAIIDVGTYLPQRAESITEISARSRSQHKSQGFGRIGRRGSQNEYLEVLKGDVPSDLSDLFSGINTTWTRVEGGAPIGELLEGILAAFDYSDPAASLTDLLHVRSMITALPDGYWKEVKLVEVERIIEGCLGLFLEAVAASPTSAPGQELELTLEAVNRSAVPITLTAVDLLPLDETNPLEAELAFNDVLRHELTVRLPQDFGYSNSYWLNDEASLGMYTVEDQLLRGKPETPRGLLVRFHLTILDPASGQLSELQVTKPVIHKISDPVKGEVYQPFEVTPPVFVNLAAPAYIYADQRSQTITAKVVAGQDGLVGTMNLNVPENWQVEPMSYDLSLAQKGHEAIFRFELTPPAEQSEGLIKPEVIIGETSYTIGRTLIQYDHIPTQTIFQEASARVVRLDIETEGHYIGYIMGAGDEIPEALEQIGYEVTVLEDQDIVPERLDDFDAIILGVRAYNTLDRMPIYQPMLMDYVEKGGTMIVQYNTTRRQKVPSQEIGPYPFTISRDRVTVEEAEVRVLAPDHPVMNEPNQITAADFEGWVQERGLYFPNEWSEEYTAILSSNDPGEPARDGGLLVAEYGDGHYVYTGYSWFRELPAGVAGAYRIFANLISLGNTAKP